MATERSWQEWQAHVRMMKARIAAVQSLLETLEIQKEEVKKVSEVDSQNLSQNNVRI